MMEGQRLNLLMYKNLTWFTACDLPAAHQSLTLVMIIVHFLSKTSSVDTSQCALDFQGPNGPTAGQERGDPRAVQSSASG